MTPCPIPSDRTALRAARGRGARQRGLSAVEILIGLAVGLVLLAGLGSMVVGSRQTSRAERNLLELQNAGRIALELASREVRKAGFRTDRERSLETMFPSEAAPFATAGAVVSGPVDGSLLVRFAGSGDTWTTDCLGNAINPGQTVWQTLSVQGGELRCRVRNLATGSDDSLPLAARVEAMALTFGIDNDADGFADAYAAAGAVTNWARVVSVGVELRVVSSEDGLADAPQPYLGFDGTLVTPTDRRLRRSYSSLVALRNVLP